MAEACSSSDEFSDGDGVEAFYSEVDRIQEDLNLEVKSGRDLLLKWKVVKEKGDQKEVYCVLEDMYDLMIELPFQDISPLILNGTPFIVSGDMLLIYAMANGNWNTHFGGHTLHLIYLCERILNFFVQKGGKFHIVFFKVWKRVFEKCPMMLLARSVLFLHFENNSLFHVHSFNSVSSKEFCVYLNTYRSSFMLVNLDFVEHAIYIFGKALFPVIGLTFYMEFFTALSYALPCVDISNLKLDISTLDAFVATPKSSFENLWDRISDDINDMLNIHEKNMNFEINVDKRKITEVLKDVDIHKFVACLACAQLLLEDDIYDDLVKSYLLYCSVIQVLPLRFRPCNFDLKLPEHVNNFITQLQYYMYTSLKHSLKYDVDRKLVADIWQGNLYSAILYYLNSKYYSEDFSVLNDCSKAQYHDLVNKTVALTGRPLNMLPVIKDKLLWPKISVAKVTSNTATSFPPMSVKSSSRFPPQTKHKSNINEIISNCEQIKSPSAKQSKHNNMLQTYVSDKNKSISCKAEDNKATQGPDITWKVDEIEKKSVKKKKKKKKVKLSSVNEEIKNSNISGNVKVNRNSKEEFSSLCKDITSLYEEKDVTVPTEHLENVRPHDEMIPYIINDSSDLNNIESKSVFLENEAKNIANVNHLLCKGNTTPISSQKAMCSKTIQDHLFTNELNAVKDNRAIRPIVNIGKGKLLQRSANSDMYLQKLLPVSCELYTSFCGSLLIDPVYMEDREVALLQGFINNNAAFDETRHWHSKQPITDELDRTKNSDHKISGKKTKYQINRMQRDQVKYKSFLSFYGRSLEGNSFYSKPIICKSNKNDHVQKPKISNKAQKIIEENQKAKFANQENTDKQKYKLFKKLFVSWEKCGDYKKAISYLEKLEKSIKSSQWLSKVLMHKGELCYKMWKSECEINIRIADRNIEYAKKLFLTIRDVLYLLQSSGTHLKDVSKKVGMWLCCLGFQDICKKWNLPVTQKDKYEMLSVGMSYIRFQLTHLGPDLERDTGAAEDSRVDDFLPDKWQRDLFDIVDKKESALIVAPTSSGKTYASYYCMRRVLEESNDGVVVYVSPTKALVNQVHATIYARFRNKVMPPGRAVCGVFTRDYRYKVLESQILITVPQCLEVLLFSPRQYDWAQRLQYVIFDEIHCLAGQAGGIAWERCLLLIRCPFLALSATVGEPENFHAWLQEMEHFKEERDKSEEFVIGKGSYRVHLVQQEGRHSDLVKHVYKEGGIHHIHPYSLLDELVVEQNNGIPSHISLSPHETLKVYDALLTVYPKSEKVKNLCPEEFFLSSKTGFLTRNFVREYETEIRVLLGCLAVQSKDKFKAVKNHLTPNGSFKKLMSGSTDSVKDVNQLIQLLYNSNMLPALFFLYNREEIEILFEKLTRYYDKNEIIHEKTKPSESKKEYTVVKKTSHETPTKKNWSGYTGAPIDMCCNIDAGSLKKAGFNDKDYKVVKKKTVDDSLPSLYLLKGNNFLKGVGVADENDIRLIEKRLVLSGYKSNDIFIKGLRLGLGIHHGGKSARERGSVEMMFRMGILRSVFATGTLALGIHMPCKTVVILGDSQYINSLEYHQMSGRAGRRGFDTCGNVIFAGLGRRKLQTLVTDKLPVMIGNFPLSIGTVLKLLLLVSRVTSKGVQQRKVTEDAVSRALTVLNCSMSYRKNPELKIQMKHFFQFSTQLLVLQGLIDENGSPQDLTGIVTYLHYHEPGNLAFVFLFRSGALRRLCEASKKKPVPLEVQFNLITVLSYLFGCVPLHGSVFKREFVNSTVIMNEPPKFIKQTFDEYNRQVKFLFDKYFRSVAANCVRTLHADNKLPLTNITFGSEDDHFLTFKENTLEKELIDVCMPRNICSVFAALSGNDDSRLYSSSELVSNIRHEIFTDIKIIPLISYESSLNSYALDFYKHGIASAIRRDNGLKAGEDFTHLKDFLLVLKTITTSLEELQPRVTSDPVLRAFQTVTKRFNQYFAHAYGLKE